MESPLALVREFFQSYIYSLLVVDEEYVVTVKDVEVLRGNTAIVRYV